jgi:hypothetical protein
VERVEQIDEPFPRWSGACGWHEHAVNKHGPRRGKHKRPKGFQWGGWDEGVMNDNISAFEMHLASLEITQSA